MRIYIAPSESDAAEIAKVGLVAAGGGGCIKLPHAAESEKADTYMGQQFLLVCHVQLGREFDCGRAGRCVEVSPPSGFDCTYEPQSQCHGVFAFARILPVFMVHAHVRREAGVVAPPPHWEQDGEMPSQGWRCISLGAETPEFDSLRQCLQTDPKDLGSGRDVVEKGKYKQLKLARAWRIENPKLWRRYAVERQSVAEEIRDRRIKVPSLRIRDVLQKALAGLPDKLQSDVHETRLLHGTAPQTVLTLLSNGPNERFSGGLFGCGTYLAEDAGKNDQYVTSDRSMGQVKPLHSRLYPKGDHPGTVYYLICCRTVLGHFVATKSGTPDAGSTEGGHKVFATDARRELGYIPGLQPPAHYHSLLAELGFHIHRHREFVVFHDARIYPEYLLAYHRV